MATPAQSRRPVPVPFDGLPDPQIEYALLWMERRVYRLQQRWMEGHLLGERRCGYGEREIAAARHHLRKRGRQGLHGRFGRDGERLSTERLSARVGVWRSE